MPIPQLFCTAVAAAAVELFLVQVVPRWELAAAAAAADTVVSQRLLPGAAPLVERQVVAEGEDF